MSNGFDTSSSRKININDAVLSGKVDMRTVDSKLQVFLLSAWPIGSIYSSLPNESPSKYFGGTWIRWGTSASPYMWLRIQPPALDIEMETGLLKQTKADGYTGPVYRLDANGNLVLEG